ncbi:hypothetical protein MHK_006498, partial [Candidatus Magnetomorum sp. HK-1]
TIYVLLHDLNVQKWEYNAKNKRFHPLDCFVINKKLFSNKENTGVLILLHLILLSKIMPIVLLLSPFWSYVFSVISRFR